MSRRTERLGKLMQQVIGRIVMTQISDPRIDAARTSITRVVVQEDLLRAKVYVSIYGTDAQQRCGLEALRHAAGRIQSLLREQVSLRHMPMLEFLTDQRFKGALKTWEIIRQAMDELEAKPGQAAPPEAPAGLDQQSQPQPGRQSGQEDGAAGRTPAAPGRGRRRAAERQKDEE